MPDELVLSDARRRFRRFVQIEPSGCWLWQGATNRADWHRYPYFWFEGRMQGAHRVAYSLFVGQIPRKYHIHHVCENTLCVNPQHLQPVPGRTNGYLARQREVGA